MIRYFKAFSSIFYEAKDFFTVGFRSLFSWTRVSYFLACLYQSVLTIALLVSSYKITWEGTLSATELALRCCIVGTLGCCLYCLRSLYIHGAVESDWDSKWLSWHLLRPFAASISSLSALVLLKAGLILLNSETSTDEKTTLWGYYFLAFVAGLNIEKFLSKIEEIGETVFGVKASRMNGKDKTARGSSGDTHKKIES